MAYSDDFQPHAPGSPYAPVLSDDAEGFYRTADMIEDMAFKLWAVAESLRERGDSDPDYSMLCDVKGRATLLADLVAKLEHAV